MIFNVLICKSVKDKYLIMHNLSHGVPRRGADAPGVFDSVSGAPNFRVIR